MITQLPKGLNTALQILLGIAMGATVCIIWCWLSPGRPANLPPGLYAVRSIDIDGDAE